MIVFIYTVCQTFEKEEPGVDVDNDDKEDDDDEEAGVVEKKGLFIIVFIYNLHYDF